MSNVGPTSSPVRVRLRDEMAAFDDLPPPVRRALAYAKVEFTAIGARELLKRVPAEFVASIITGRDPVPARRLRAVAA